MMVIGNNYNNLNMIGNTSIEIRAIDRIILQANIKCSGKVILQKYEEIKPKEEELEKNSLYCTGITCTTLAGTNLEITVEKNVYIMCENINTNIIVNCNDPSGISINPLRYSISYALMVCDNLYLHSKNLDISEINSNFISSNLRKNKIDNILKKMKKK